MIFILLLILVWFCGSILLAVGKQWAVKNIPAFAKWQERIRLKQERRTTEKEELQYAELVSKELSYINNIISRLETDKEFRISLEGAIKRIKQEEKSSIIREYNETLVKIDNIISDIREINKSINTLKMMRDLATSSKVDVPNKMIESFKEIEKGEIILDDYNYRLNTLKSRKARFIENYDYLNNT